MLFVDGGVRHHVLRKCGIVSPESCCRVALQNAQLAALPCVWCHVQSKVTMRLEDPGTDFVRLLVRTVTLPPAPDYTSNTAASRELQQVLPPQAGHVSNDDEDGGSEQQAVSGPVLSPSAVEALLSSQSQCEVLLQEESRWLVVSETFSPGEICR